MVCGSGEVAVRKYHHTIGLTADGVHGPVWFYESGRIDLVAFPLAPDVLLDNRSQCILIHRMLTQDRFHVVFSQRKQAMTELAICGQADAVATLAEGPGDAGDHANAADAVGVLELHGRVAGVIIAGWKQWAECVFELFHDFMSKVALLSFPGFRANGHVFNVAHFNACLTGISGEWHDIDIVDASDDHSVHLDAGIASSLGRFDATQHEIQPIPASELAEAGFIKGIETDIETINPRFVQGFRLLGQQQGIGCQSDIIDARNAAEHGTEFWQALAQQRLATSEPQFVNSQAGCHSDELRHLLEGEQFPFIQKNHFFRHAINAAEIAAIGHADAQIIVYSTKGVEQAGS